jgi:hypothetical protein
VRFSPKPRVVGEDEDRASFAGLSLLWGPLVRVDVTEASATAGLVFYGPKGMRVTVVETSSLPDPAVAVAAAAEAAEEAEEAEEAKVARRLAGVAAMVAEAAAEAAEAAEAAARDDGDAEETSSSPEIAPSVAAAMAEAAAFSMQSPAQTSPYKSMSATGAAEVVEGVPEVVEEEQREEGGGGGGGFYQRLVKEVHFKSPEGDVYGPLHDISVSGMGGWIRVVRESRRGECDIGLKVWGPRGLEVFVRKPMPTAL